MKEIYYTQTENGAIQFNSTGSANLDLFASIGSCREMANNSPEILLKKFQEAYLENPINALSTLFWSRAVREGAGERKVFEVIIKDICETNPLFIMDNLSTIVKYGRWKDLSYIYDIAGGRLCKKIVDFWAENIQKLNALACKWLPKKSELYRKVQEKLGFTNKKMRQYIAEHSNTVEQKMCAKEWDKIDYSKIPSQSLNKYKNAFERNDKEHFYNDLATKKINAGAIYPHEILWEYNNHGEEPNLATEKLWKNIPNFIDPKMRFIPVVDCSGSMCSRVGKFNALYIARALGIYCSEHLEGDWKDKAILFSSSPQFIDCSKCETLYDKNQIYESFDDCSNTDIANVFKLILNASKKCKDKSTIPNTVLILSDMQFDYGARYNVSLMDEMRILFKSEGIEFPSIIYWNLYGTNTGFMDSKYENVAFASGFNPKLMQAIFKGMRVEYKNGERKVKIDPIEVMNKALESFVKTIDFTHVNTNISSVLKDVQLNTTIGKSIRTKSVKNETFLDCIENNDD